MNERISDELAEQLAAHRARAATRAGVQAVEEELHAEATDAVEVALYVKGRMIHTNTDSATVQRIMAILTGLE